MYTRIPKYVEAKDIKVTEDIKLSESVETKTQPVLESKIPEKKWELISVSSDAAVDVIKQERGLVKVIESKLGDDSHWIFLLQQLCYPNLYRPVTTLDPNCDRTEVFDTTPGNWSYKKREISGKRGRYKLTEFTKKTAMSLLPKDGKMTLFNANKINIGILLDIDLCKLPVTKEGRTKYIFEDNANTNNRWWIKGNDPSYYYHACHSISLKDLRKYIRERRDLGVIPSHNELLVKLQRKAVCGVFATKDTLTDRLNALDKKFLLLQWLKIDVPVLIITSEQLAEKEIPSFKYETQQWLNDLIAALNGDQSVPAYGYAVKIIRSLQSYDEKIWINFYNQINRIDPDRAIFLLNYEEINKTKDLLENKTQMSLLKDLNNFGISDLSINYLEKCEILNWLIVRKSPWVVNFAKNILENSYIASQCFKTAVEHQYFDVVRELLNLSEIQTEIWNNTTINTAFTLLYLYSENELAKITLKKYHPGFASSLKSIALPDNTKFLSDKEIENDCTQTQLDCLIYELSKSEDNYINIHKILDLREDIPHASWTQDLEVQNKKNILHLLLGEKQPDFLLIKKLVNRLPSLLTDEDKNNETPFSLAAKYNLEELFTVFWEYAEKNHLFSRMFSTHKQKIALYLCKSYYHIKKDENDFEEKQNFFSEKIFKLIDEKQIDRNKIPHDEDTGNTALHYMAASTAPILKIVEKLCLLTHEKSENKASDITFASEENKNGDTPLILAIQHNASPQIIGMLIHKQNYSDKQFSKALHCLIKHNQYGFARTLLKTNPKLAELTCFRHWEIETGNNALHMLMLADDPNLELIKFFLNVPSSTRQNKNSETALFIAAKRNQLEVLQYVFSEPNILKLYDNNHMKKIVLQLIENKQFKIVYDFLKKKTLEIPSAEWSPVFINMMDTEIKSEHKELPKSLTELKTENTQPQSQFEFKRKGLVPVSGFGLENKTSDTLKNINPASGFGLESKTSDTLENITPVSGFGLESKTSDTLENINIEFELFKLLSKNIFSEKNIALTKPSKDGDDILTLAMKTHRDDIALFIINHFNPLFERDQYVKMFATIVADNQKYHFSPKVIYAFLEKASYNLSVDMMEICIDLYINNSREMEKSCTALPHPKFLDYLPGDTEKKRIYALYYIKFILKSAISTHEIMEFIVEFAQLKSHMRFFYPADDKPRIEILNYAKKKMLKLMEKDPSQLDDVRACTLITSSAGNDKSYANKLKKLKAKQLEQTTKDTDDLMKLLKTLN